MDIKIGTIFRVLPKFSLNKGVIESTTKFVIIVDFTKNGTPIVSPLNENYERHLSNNYNKTMHKSKNGWNVYGHNTEIVLFQEQ